jgi:hypothetical protein
LFTRTQESVPGPQHVCLKRWYGTAQSYRAASTIGRRAAWFLDLLRICQQPRFLHPSSSPIPHTTLSGGDKEAESANIHQYPPDSMQHHIVGVIFKRLRGTCTAKVSGRAAPCMRKNVRRLQGECRAATSRTAAAAARISAGTTNAMFGLPPAPCTVPSPEDAGRAADCSWPSSHGIESSGSASTTTAALAAVAAGRAGIHAQHRYPANTTPIWQAAANRALARMAETRATCRAIQEHKLEGPRRSEGRSVQAVTAPALPHGI